MLQKISAELIAALQTMKFGMDGNPESDKELKDFERVLWEQDIYEYFEKEVKPYAPDAWIDESVCDAKDGQIGKVGYEIPFTRYFYKYEAPRPLDEVARDIKEIERETDKLMKKLFDSE